eukprot:COSAG02_NODE_10836_length_1848_cov_1.996569_3_plen_188_part_01
MWSAVHAADSRVGIESATPPTCPVLRRGDAPLIWDWPVAVVSAGMPAATTAATQGQAEQYSQPSSGWTVVHGKKKRLSVQMQCAKVPGEFEVLHCNHNESWHHVNLRRQAQWSNLRVRVPVKRRCNFAHDARTCRLLRVATRASAGFWEVCYRGVDVRWFLRRTVKQQFRALPCCYYFTCAVRVRDVE